MKIGLLLYKIIKHENAQVYLMIVFKEEVLQWKRLNRPVTV